MIRVVCGSCGKSLKVADEAAGKTGKCPACGAAVKVPAADAIAAHNDVAPDVPQPPRPVLTPNPVQLRPPVAPTVVAVQVQHPSKASHSLGIASLVLGVVAFLICWIPLVGLIGLPLSILGVILGGLGLVIALFRKGSGIGFPIAGTSISLLSTIVAIGITSAAANAFNEIGKSLDQASTKANATNQAVVGPSRPSETAADDATSTPNGEREMPPEQLPVEPEWADARDAVQQGDLQVRIANVTVDKVPLTDILREGSRSKEDLLMVRLELLNTNPTKKVDYHAWAGRDISFDRDYATLEDNFGNTYKRISFGFSSRPVGAVESSESIYPNKSVTDVLVFEVPLDSIDYLRLELPAKNFGGTGMLRLQIPKEMIVR